MSKLLEISNEELELVIQNTSDRLNMSKAIVEKDLWVCNDLCYRQVIVFNFPSAPPAYVITLCVFFDQLKTLMYVLQYMSINLKI